MRHTMLRVEYDRSADAAYIYLTEIGAGQVASTYPCDPSQVRGQINLDFDADGRLLGIEVLDASKFLPADLLDAARNMGQRHIRP
jgi:uncharacterized protein YuzE